MKSIKCFSLNHYLPILIFKNGSTVGEEEFAWKSPLYWCSNNLNLGQFPWHQICNLLVDGIIVGQGESLAGGGVEDSVNVVEHLGPSCRVLDWFLIKYFHGLHKPLWPSSASFNSEGLQDSSAELDGISSTQPHLFANEWNALFLFSRCHLFGYCCSNLLRVGGPLVCLQDWVAIAVASSIGTCMAFDDVDIIA